ncbi:trypsin-1-like [Athalia rosae]|uniref:trypsin-1-like n=1 Tax=Athalia rosae TaxID=37344 RepID=UPI0020345A54|nr:trypsin-1-like [Athalia rosae]
MWLTTTLIISLGISACLALPGHAIGRIVNGTDAEPGERPFQISLQTTGRFHFCGGFILNAHYAVTAAHCLTDATAWDLLVVVGTNDIGENRGIVRSVRRIKVHENYDLEDALRNDIALLELTEYLPEIPNVVEYGKLPDADQSPAIGDDAVVSGWGEDENGQFPKLLQVATLEISDQDDCKKIYNDSFNVEVDETQICSVLPEGGKGSCHSDSGGPMTVNGVVTGIVSWGAGCGQKGYPDVLLRVSKYLDWIKNNAV